MTHYTPVLARSFYFSFSCDLRSRMRHDRVVFPDSPPIAAMTHPEYILTLSCLDQRGIVHRVSGFLADHGCNIIDSAQFGDAESRLFFMRVHFALEDRGIADALLRADFGALAEEMGLNWELRDAHYKPRVML